MREAVSPETDREGQLMLDERDVPAAATSATGDLTVSQLWHWLTADGSSDELLDWAPDVAALTTVLLERSQAFRFAVSPPAGVVWPPDEAGPFTSSVASAAAEWRAMMDRGSGGAPDLVVRLWATVKEHLDTPVAEMTGGRAWPLCEAVLLLHAIADEASAGCGGGGGARVPAGSTAVAQAQEMLARTGTLARLPAERVALLPKTRTTGVGMTHRSLSRYSCTSTSGIPTTWHRIPIRRLGSEPAARHANVLLLPWPLHIRESDFEPLPGSVRRPEREPFGFFQYTPSEPVDLDLVDGLLEAALHEVDRVDVVALPESCLHESEVTALEAVLARHRVSLLVAGLRLDPTGPDRWPGNAVHIGALLGDQWWHYRQHKHHRWFLDSGQVQQYDIAGALTPGVRWWEAMELPQRSVNVLELGGGITVAAVVCEDLARLDGVAELLRSVGPTLVVTLLLDGPQLASRWTARYAGVLADDPGSAVLTLTASGMATRSRPPGKPPSRVVAMWKDPLRGLQEIPLEEGAQGVLLKAEQRPSPRYAADGRAPADDATDLYVTGVQQLRAAAPRVPPTDPLAETGPVRPTLATTELSVLCSWTGAVAHALADAGVPAGHRTDGVVPAASRDLARSRLEDVLDAARPGAAWRARMGLPEPSDQLAGALDALGRFSRSVLEQTWHVPADGALAALETVPVEDQVGRLVRRVLRTALDAGRR